MHNTTLDKVTLPVQGEVGGTKLGKLFFCTLATVAVVDTCML